MLLQINLHLGVGILQMWYGSSKYHFCHMSKCQENYPSAFRAAPNCTVSSNKMVSDVIQTNRCIHFFQGETGNICKWQHIYHSASAGTILVSYYFSQTVQVQQFETLLSNPASSVEILLSKEFPQELCKWMKFHANIYLFNILTNTAIPSLDQQ